MTTKAHSFIGLTRKEAELLLKEHGANVLPEAKQPGVLQTFFRQFLSPLIYVLLAAAFISLWMGRLEDAAFIVIVLLINATIGTFQEYSAQKTVQALKKLVPQMVHVLRDGKERYIPSAGLVPGDIVLFVSGDKVPADIQVLSAQGISVDESLLTGESTGVEKEAYTEDTKEEKKHYLFAGTIITRGRAIGKVTSTGIHTEIGKISKIVAGGRTTKPPMMIRMEKFTLNLSLVMLGAIILLFLVQWTKGHDIREIFLIAVALAVAAIPEGLPAAITITLAVGMHRMAQHNVIIRKLVAVESLGSCTMIAADKTGTLTINEMTIRKVVLPDGNIVDITGEGLRVNAHKVKEQDKKLLQQLCHAGILANEATFHYTEEETKAEGDKVDIAFLVLGYKCGLSREILLDKMPEISVIPYESEHAYSGSLHNDKGIRRLYIKGSLEALLPMCTTMRSDIKETHIAKDTLISYAEALAAEGYRVMGLAEGIIPENKPLPSLNNPSDTLTFLGLVGMIDPLRPEAKDAVAECRNAGIEVAMVTGDHPVTALALAKALDLPGHENGAITGKELHKIEKQGKEALSNAIGKYRVFARVEPMQKRTIVDVFSKQGHFVAVTGDGVNDAPALRHAHVGVAMGERGTDVARESADIILTDDNFASIVHGIEQGRIVYNNIRKVIFLLVSTGMAELVLFFFSMIFQIPLPLTAVQLLWLNLVTNGIQHIALAFDPAEGDELKYPPRKPEESIFNRLMAKQIIVSALWMGGIAFYIFYWLTQHGHTNQEAGNMTLLLMVLFENIQVLNAHSERHSITINFLSNKFLLICIVMAQGLHITAMHLPVMQKILGLSPVALHDWTMLLFAALSLLAVGELQKYLHPQKTF